jgi:serine phosphatase RsbU (regulator of sigma subunit)
MSDSTDASFDRYARIVRRALGVPIALVTIIEDERQVFVGAVGLPEPYQTTRETPLSHSFCQYVVKDQKPLVITDARQDDQLRHNLAIEDLSVVAYLGWPLTDATGTVIGALCAIDSQPREWTATDLSILEDLAGACSAELAERELRRGAGASASVERAIATQSQLLLALSEALSNTVTVADIAAAVHRVAVDGLTCNHAGIWLVDDRAGPEGSLRYVANPEQLWPQAERNAILPLGRTNPLGTAILESQPLYYRDRASQDADYPDLVAPPMPGEGLARAIVPLPLPSDRLGCLALLWPGARDFTPDERVLFKALAMYTAHAVERATLLADRAHVATTLQTAMLTDLPQPDDLELVARYRPAAARDEVGGDWYDAVLLPSGATALMIGDVVGHDIEAAAIMGQLRSMLRAFAWDHDVAPAENVARLDRAMRDLQIGRGASLIFARIEQTAAHHAAGLRTLRWTNAGHLPPVLLTADGATRFLDDGDRADPMLGVEAAADRHDQTAELPPGSTLLLYTDGLVERRSEGMEAGLHRLTTALTDALADCRTVAPGDALGAFVDTVLANVLGASPDDDVAMLAVRFHPQDPTAPD